MDKAELFELWTLCQIPAAEQTLAQHERLTDLAALAVCALREQRASMEALARAMKEASA